MSEFKTFKVQKFKVQDSIWFLNSLKPLNGFRIKDTS